MFEYQLIERARADRQRIVLPESQDDRILEAAAILLRRGVANLTLLGDGPQSAPAPRPSVLILTKRRSSRRWMLILSSSLPLRTQLPGRTRG
jgi:hypothetical protein